MPKCKLVFFSPSLQTLIPAERLESIPQGTNEERPLKHSHNVLHLLKAINNEDKLTEGNLSPFVGDPRYPYPNKTAISNDLITSYELSQLLATGGFLNKETEKLFQIHFPSQNKMDFVNLQNLLKEKNKRTHGKDQAKDPLRIAARLRSLQAQR